MGARFLTCDSWKELLENSGLSNIEALDYKTNAVSQWIEEVKQFEFLDFMKAWNRYLYMFFVDKDARNFTREALSFPGSIFRLFEYFGYGLYAGCKGIGRYQIYK